MEKVRILFIAHTANMVGGASQSLKNLIINLDEKADMVVSENMSVRIKDIKKFYGPNINKVYRANLPYRQSICAIAGPVDWIDWIQTERNFRQAQKEIYRIIRENDYDVVHLNSYVLYPLISRQYPMYIHVREVCNANWLFKRFIQAYFKRSRGIIYIDDTTREALAVKKRCTVLNNPFDQRKVLEVDQLDVRNRYHIRDEETVFTYIAATTSSTKGRSFVENAFIRANCKNARLLLVGPQKKTASKHPGIISTGEVSRMEEIYAITDYVLRGDNVAAIGRTIYEGLYSGCNVIIPGDEEYGMDKMFECDRFKDRIFFYKLRNMDSLVHVIRERNGLKKDGVLGLSNVDQYVDQFKKFVFGKRRKDS